VGLGLSAFSISAKVTAKICVLRFFVFLYLLAKAIYTEVDIGITLKQRLIELGSASYSSSLNKEKSYCSKVICDFIILILAS
jgi:hypothetical protein